MGLAQHIKHDANLAALGEALTDLAHEPVDLLGTVKKWVKQTRENKTKTGYNTKQTSLGMKRIIQNYEGIGYGLR